MVKLVEWSCDLGVGLIVLSRCLLLLSLLDLMNSSVVPKAIEFEICIIQ